MPKYHIIYRGFMFRSPVFVTDHEANTETEARVWFNTYYNGEIMQIRKGLPFTEAEIKKQKEKAKYS